MGMLVHKQLYNQKNEEGHIETPEEDLDIPGFVE